MKEGTPHGQRWLHGNANQQHKEAGHLPASKRLHTLSRPGQEAALSRHRPDVSQTRHCHQVNFYKATCHRGTDSTL